MHPRDTAWAMSEENVERVRKGYAAWNKRDMDAMLARLHPQVEFMTSGVFLGQDAVYSGHDGFRKFWRDFSGTWESILVSVNELRDCGERVLALVTFEARGRDGLEVGRQTGSVWTFRDGLVFQIENYRDWDLALEAAGVRE